MANIDGNITNDIVVDTPAFDEIKELVGEINYYTKNTGGGTDDYNELINKPMINGITLQGDISSTDLGIKNGTDGKDGKDGIDGIDGKDATINGENTLNIVEGNNIIITQEGSTLTISATGGGTGGGVTIEEVRQEIDTKVPAWSREPTKPTYTAEEVGALPSTTQIPTKTSELTNDSDYTTKSYVDTLVGDIGTVLDEINGVTTIMTDMEWVDL